MGGKCVASLDVTTFVEPTVEEMLKLVAIDENPTPLDAFAPGEPGNEIDVENSPDFETPNQAFPLPPPLRRSKRQARYDPDFLEPKKFKASSYSMNLLDPDFSSGDDSENEHFQIVARPKVPIKTGEPSHAQTATDEENNSDNEESLAEFLSQLKSGKKATSTAPKPTTVEEPETEMLEEFADNRPNPSDSSSSTSSSDSADSTSDEVDGVSDEDVAGSEQNVDRDVVNIIGNTDVEDFNLSTSFSTKFYSEAALVLWPLYNNCGQIEERIIDVEAYDRQNVVKFLRNRNLLSTVTASYNT